MNTAEAPAQPPGLTDLPNISPLLAESLQRVGLTTAEALKLAGAEAAWNLLRENGQPASIETLLVLEGAIQGVHWQTLPPARRFELMRFVAAQVG
jgi:hypothetical protein